VIDAYVSNIAILDENRTVLCVNRAWRQFAIQTGSLIDQVGIGRQYPEACTGTAAAVAADTKTIAKGIEDVIEKKESSFQMEFRCVAIPEPMWFRLHAEGFLLRDDGKSVVLVSHENITSEKQAKESLSECLERLERLQVTTQLVIGR